MGEQTGLDTTNGNDFVAEKDTVLATDGHFTCSRAKPARCNTRKTGKLSKGDKIKEMLSAQRF